MMKRCLLPLLFFSAALCAAAQDGSSVRTDGSGRLRLLDYDDCQFAAGTGASTGAGASAGAGSRNVVTVDAGTFAQSVFDSLCRVVERTEWKNAASSRDCVLLARKTYRYRTAADPADVLPSQVTENRYDRHSLTETFFDAAGNPVKVQEFSTAGAKRSKLRERTMRYDASRRLTEESVVSYDGKTPRKKTTYSYTGKSSRPDSRYYEDGMLRIVTVYSTEDSCVVDTYFEKDYVVSVRYTDGRRTLETVTVGGRERSRRSFDE